MDLIRIFKQKLGLQKAYTTNKIKFIEFDIAKKNGVNQYIKNSQNKIYDK
jgi:hypothetical protein